MYSAALCDGDIGDGAGFKTDDFCAARVDLPRTGGEIPGPRAEFGDFKREPQPLVALVQCFLGALPFAHCRRRIARIGQPAAVVVHWIRVLSSTARGESSPPEYQSISDRRLWRR